MQQDASVWSESEFPPTRLLVRHLWGFFGAVRVGRGHGDMQRRHCTTCPLHSAQVGTRDENDSRHTEARPRAVWAVWAARVQPRSLEEGVLQLDDSQSICCLPGGHDQCV